MLRFYTYWSHAGALFALHCAILLYLLATSAPTQDEPAQFASSVAVALTGDPAFYRVNPPAPKIVTGAIVLLVRDPTLPPMPHASVIPSGIRSVENSLADAYYQRNVRSYSGDLRIGRLVHFLVLFAAALAAGRWLFRRYLGWESLIATILWTTSPLILGHGWTVMPDAMSAAAMIGVVLSTLGWLRVRSWESLLVTGLCWGLAISTKFTFCPIYLLWPVAVLGHEYVLRGLNAKHVIRLLCAHIGQGVLAFLVVIVCYNCSELGVSFSNHGFASKRMQSLFDHELIRQLPSPFPKQFLVGIDEQQLDLERGYPTYVFGTWYPKGVWWYYLFGLAAKESLACWLAALLFPFGVRKLWRQATKAQTTLSTNRLRPTASKDHCRSCSGPRIQQQKRADLVFCALVSAIVIVILSLHVNMALNVRYVMPALPPMYFALAIAMGQFFQPVRASGSSHVVGSAEFSSAKFPAKESNRAGELSTRWFSAQRLLVIAFTALAIGELLWVFPNHFAYINPLAGGMYRVPSVLHDSNFDGGQDALRLTKAYQHGRWEQREVYVFLNTKLPIEAFDVPMRIPSHDLIERLVQSHTPGNTIPWRGPPVALIISRGFEAPMPWTELFGERLQVDPLVSKRLLRLPPDRFLTPILSVYLGGNLPEIETRAN